MSAASCYFLLAKQPIHRAGVRLQLFSGDTPKGALLVLAHSPVETVLQDSVFYQLPAPALAVVNSTVRLNNTQVSSLSMAAAKAVQGPAPKALN